MGLFSIKPESVEEVEGIVELLGPIDPSSANNEELRCFPSVLDFRTSKRLGRPSGVIYPKKFQSQAGIDIVRLIVGVATEDKEDEPFVHYEVVTPNDIVGSKPEDGLKYEAEFAQHGIAKALFDLSKQITNSPHDQRHIAEAIADMSSAV